MTMISLALTLTAFGQSYPSHKATHGDDRNKIPIHEIVFGDASPIEGITATPALVLPLKCTSDSTAFLQMVTPETGQTTLYSVHGTTGIPVSGSPVPDLRDVEVQDYFPSDREIAFLVHGTPLKDPSRVGDRADLHLPKARQPYFIVVFSRKAEYHRTVQLPPNIGADNLAILDSGELVVSSFDLVNQTPRLQVLSADGTLEREIDQPMKGADRVAGLDATLSAAATHFSPYGQNVLVWRMGKNDPILEIGPGPIVREIALKLPAGQILADLIPSGTGEPWILHADAEDNQLSKDHQIVAHVDDRLYYEVSPLDGSLIRKLTIPNISVGALACRTGGHYLSFSTNDKKQLLEFQGQ